MAKKVERGLKDVASVVSLGATNKAAQMLDPNIPQPGEPEVAPIPDDEAVEAAARRKAARRKKAGRASTILTEESTLG